MYGVFWKIAKQFTKTPQLSFMMFGEFNENREAIFIKLTITLLRGH